MNLTVWKYIIPEVYPPTKIKMPKNARILDVQVQFDQIGLWALVDPNVEQEERYFAVFGTGHPINTGMDFDGKEIEYVGTFQLAGGSFVGHVFEVKP